MSTTALTTPSAFGRQVMRAVAWRSGSQMIAQAIMWTATFCVIRILSPADYGLFAMTQSVLVFLSLLNGQEFAVSLIRAPELTDRAIRQTFGLLLTLNGVIAAAQWLLAPLAAAYFHHPLVAAMLRVQALLYLANPFIVLPSALLSREMNYRVQAKVNLLSAVTGAGVSLGGALAGLGVWTLVAAPLAAFWVRAVGMTIAWGRFPVPSFRLWEASATVRFGSAMLLSSLLWLIQTQADVVIGGRALDPHHLGLYTEALFLTQIVTAKFIPPLNDVAFSAYARLQDDRATTGRAFEKSVRLIMLGALPFYFGLAVTAQPFVDVVLGPQWREAAPVVRCLALVMPFVTLQILFPPAATALGRPRVQVLAAGIGAVLLPIGFLVGVRWGAVGMAASWLATFPLLMLGTAWLAIPVIGTSARGLARAVVPPLLASVGMAAVVLTVDRLMPGLAALPRLALLVASGVATYAALVLLLARDVLDEGLALVRARATPA